jgi:acetylornithine/succinyldiaminopimelate/putrescine aminotransferase
MLELPEVVTIASPLVVPKADIDLAMERIAAVLTTM